MRVVAYYYPSSRSRALVNAFARGARRLGDEVGIKSLTAYRPDDVESYDAVAFYGWRSPFPTIAEAFLAAGKRLVFFDLGYLDRLRGGRFRGYHKVALDGRHPSAAQLAADVSTDRLDRLGLKLLDRPPLGVAVLVAGMSAKSAATYGYGPEEWERKVIARLHRVTARPVLYRPKPSWREASRLEGALWADPAKPVQIFLKTAHLVVTHHSNVGVDALVAAVPVYAEKGAARGLGPVNLASRSVEDPPLPTLDERRERLKRVAYCQWNLDELASGTTWRHLRERYL